MNNNKIKGISTILVERRNSLYIEKEALQTANMGSVKTSQLLMVTFNIKLQQRGFRLTETSEKILSTIPLDKLKDILLIYLDVIDKNIGNDIKYVPMYPGFPDEVITMSDMELYNNAVMHYLSNGTWQPRNEERLNYLASIQNDRLDFEFINNIGNCKLLDIIDDDDEVRKIFFNIISSKTSLSRSDIHAISVYFEYMHNVGDVLPPINYKENLALITNMSIEKIGGIENINVSDYRNIFKTSTDVLRYYVAVSGGDVSLATPCKFKNCPRKQYKFMMDLLNNIKNLKEDMARYPEYWKRVGEKIHPGSYSHSYDHVKEAFRFIRNNEKYKSWLGIVDGLCKSGKWSEAADKLIERPGEFARKLDYLLRNSDEETCNKVVSLFIQNAQKLTIPVLLQVMKHFESRNNAQAERTFFPKGQTSKVYVKENTLEVIDDKYTIAIAKTAKNAIKSKLAEKDFMGNVYIDKSFDGFVVPLSQRSASDGSKLAVRGSRWKLKNDTNIIRSFVWWTNMKTGERIDVDLSAQFLDEEFNPLFDVSYLSMKFCKDNKTIAVHSGDITNGGDPSGIGASEFVDCNITNAIQYGARYVIFTIFNFTCDGIKFKDFNSKAGFMEIEETSSSEQIFNPLNVEMNIDVSAPANIVIPFAIDLKSREVIWLDMSTDTKNWTNNIRTNRCVVLNSLKAIIKKNHPMLSDLIRLNIEARGIEVDSPDKADIIFSLNKDNDKTITPWELDRFTSEYM